ncbi:MAG: D-alanyl-D-alanine carboxypeptidase family protein [Oscillospiraceae bacterium]|nr:D-alanyl-D-alanine carboxypeptidase family protein [Oscillospiraceae bacterium]
MKKKFLRWACVIAVAACVLVLLVIVLQPRDGWHEKEGQTMYYLDGKPVTGWQAIESSKYYFNEEGILYTGWQTIDGHTYYLGTDGALATGWLKLGDAQYYLCSDGVRVTGWQDIGGARYCFGDDGRMLTGIVLEDGAAYLLNAQGQLSTGWVELDGKFYYADGNCHPLFGWNEIGGRQHYFDDTGAAASGWVKLDGFTYYFYTDGAPAQGMVVIDGEAHHFASNGQQLYLVNPWNKLPEDYTVDLTPINDTHKVATIGYQDFLDMMADCEAAGHVPVVCSSYRTQEYQEGLFQNRIDRYVEEGYSEQKATELAGKSVAIPGTSEHQLGLALDIVDNKNWKLDESQAEMPTQKWLMENSWRYGWILRYPSEKSEITGIIYEPWHYRYVGKTVAREIHELDICLEEYLEMLTNSVG